MYDAVQLNSDAAGYGLVIGLAKGSSPVHAGGLSTSRPGFTPSAPLLQAEVANTFLHGLYALVRTTRHLTIYRFYGASPVARASLLGAFWTPARPSLRIDRLGYESMHDASRADLSLRRVWNPMTDVVEAQMAVSALIYVGRVAPQSELGARLGGGAIQFFVSNPGHRLHLTRSYHG
jgi:hypothetical protein